MSSRTRDTADGSDADRGQSGRRRIRYRPDIEGIRAIALLLALLCHGGLALFAGGFVGVDMFFVISGFLITGLLLAESEGTGRISLTRFYAHRMKRLMPLATLVLVFTAIGSYLLFAAPQREIVAGDELTAALQVVNWHFAAQAVDYFGPETAASPVMHYWSLSIEEQFYIVWALALVAVTVFARRRRWSVRNTVLALVLIIWVSSLTYSAIYSAESPNAAYFSTFTRAWQIATGALIALLPIPAPGRRTSWLLSIGGAAAVLYSVLAFSSATVYPGLAGLLPVLGTAALIVAGLGREWEIPQRWLAVVPLVYVGGLSYAWYLWHYPVMIFGIAYWGSLRAWQTTALVLLAAIPAAISHHLIGQPLRYSKYLTRFPRRAMALGLACTAVAVVAAGTLAVTVPSLTAAPETDQLGASVLKPPRLQASAESVRPVPSGKGSRSDRGAVWDEGCMVEPEETQSGECVFGRPGGRRTVVLLGDSHAMHFFGMVERVAEKRDWRVVALNKAGCPPFDTPVFNPKVGREFEECRVWRERALQRIERDERPAVVFVAGSIWHKSMRDERIVSGPENVAALQQGYERVLARLAVTGARIIALKDLPKAPHDMTDCVAANMGDLKQCAFDQFGAEPDHFDVRAARRVDGVEPVDLSPAICAKGTCYGVIRNALVYRDNDHITWTFARTLAPWLERELDRDKN